jgi:hypothetical protein
VELITPEAAHIQPQGFTMVDTPEGTLITIDPSMQQSNNNEQLQYMSPGKAGVPTGVLTGPELDAARLRPRAGPGNGNASAAAGSSGVLLLAGVLAVLALLGL